MTALPFSVAEEFFDVLAARVADVVIERLEGSPEWLRVEQAAEHLGTTPNGIRALVKRGKVPVYRRDGRLFFDRRELDDYVRGNAE
jgi:excisionase family DNA binding protein